MTALRSIIAKCVLFGCFLVAFVVGQEVVHSESELQAMSDDELEQLCVIRGFELVKDDVDPATGELHKLSHDDFVEAAQRCLAIEQEMNQLLDEYPELAEELEEEIKKMEAEQGERRAEVEGLQNKLAEAETTNSTPGTAFVSKPQNAEEDELEIGEEEPILVDEKKAEEAKIDKTYEDEIPNEPLVEEESEPKSEELKSAELESKEETSPKQDFTTKALGFEMIRELLKQMESDLKRIVELLAPVVTPILRAGDVAWRHIRATIVTLRNNYESSRNSNEEADSCEEEAV